MSGIRLHPKYGVNPTMPVCFWCGEPKNEVVLLGSAIKGEAPRNMVLNYDPCDRCKAGMESGVTLIEVQSTPMMKNQKPISKGAYPTGRWIVLAESGVQRLKELIQPPDLFEQIVEARKVFVERDVFNIIMPADQEDKNGSSD